MLIGKGGYDSISFVFSSRRAARSFLSEKEWACSWRVRQTGKGRVREGKGREEREVVPL